MQSCSAAALWLNDEMMKILCNIFVNVNCSYLFFSEHFPYFKTAPNGWKNSVRHNLSLNKCFEKIEKPAGNGTNQRKGCLWAMNPAKIQKMDEEVQKWSRKDPMAIKKGMLLPRKSNPWLPGRQVLSAPPKIIVILSIKFLQFY